MKPKETPITARPLWDEEKQQFITTKQDEYTKEELCVLKYIGEFLKIVSIEIKISVANILTIDNYKKRNASPDVTLAHRLTYRFVEEFFPDGLYLVQILLNKNDDTFLNFARSHKRFFNDQLNEILFNEYVDKLIFVYKQPSPISLKKRTVLILEEKQQSKIPKEFEHVSPEDLLEVIFLVIKNEFGVDLEVLKLGTKDKKIQYNLYTSRRISIGILLSIFGEDYSLVGLYPYFSFLTKEYSQTAGIVSYYKFEHLKDINDNKVYQLLFKHIYDKVLVEIKNKKPA